MPSRGEFDTHEEHVNVAPIRKIAYGMGGVAQGLIADTFNANYLTLYNMLLGYDARVIGVATSIPIVIDALTDPVMGQLSDNTRTRWGRRRPYILFGGLAGGLATMALWLAPGGVRPNTFFVYLFAMFLLYSLANKVVGIPYGALGLELSIDYHERTKVQVYKVFISTLISGTLTSCAFYFANLDIFPGTVAGFRWVGVIYSGLAILFYWFAFIGTREEAEVQSQPRIPWLVAFKATCTNGPFLVVTLSLLIIVVGIFSVSPLGNYISIYYVFDGNMKGAAFLGMIGGFLTNAIVVLLLPVFTAWAIRVGKKRVYVLCTVVLALTFLSTLFIYNPKYPYLMLIFNVLLAVPLNGVMIMPFAMIADVCDLDELRTGFRREGAFNGVLSLLSKLCLMVPPLIIGFIIHWVHFEPEAATQPPGTILAMRLIMAFVPTVVLLLGAILAAFYRLTEKRVGEVREILEARRLERIAESGASANAHANS